jgi:hypothetical protein
MDVPVYSIFRGTIGGVEGLALPAVMNDETEVTALDSTAREYLLTLPDSGESTFTLYIRDGITGTDFSANQELLEDAAFNRTVERFRVTLPPSVGGKSYAVDGLVKQFQVTANSMQAITATVTIRYTGPVTRA